MAVLAFDEGVPRLEIKGLADEAGNSERVGEGFGVGDAAAAARRQTAADADAFAAAVVRRAFAIALALIAAGDRLFLDRRRRAIDGRPSLL